MVALLVSLGVMAVMLSVALPAWRTIAQREREAELVFRGQQYARAIGLFQRKYANAFPPSLDVLVEQKFLRRKYVDPVTRDEFQLIYVGQAQEGGAARGTGPQGRAAGAGTPAGLSATPAGGRAGIMGVTSKSTGESIRQYNGRSKYNEWAFVAVQATTSAGAPSGGQTPGGGVGGGVVGPGARPGGPPPVGGGRPGGPNPTSPGGDPQQPFGGLRRGGRL